MVALGRTELGCQHELHPTYYEGITGEVGAVVGFTHEDCPRSADRPDLVKPGWREGKVCVLRRRCKSLDCRSVAARSAWKDSSCSLTRQQTAVKHILSISQLIVSGLLSPARRREKGKMGCCHLGLEAPFSST